MKPGKKLLAPLSAAVMLALAWPAQATLTFSPDGQFATSTDNSALDANDVEGLVFDKLGLTVDLTELYKANAPESATGTAVEDKQFSGSYETIFGFVPGDPADDASSARITHVNGTISITCPECFLLVKDGSADPAQYLFNLRDSDGNAWNGTMPLELTNFWPGNDRGAISHVSIFGNNAPTPDEPPVVGVPAPATLALLGLGLFGLGVVARRKSA